ncbi:MAG: ATP-binding protein [Candidatus Tectomicrobia bacterium]|uniref:ATP-binding protein n=1 Tax=Tectimicrobiota bacterium TaxID=2528274 RepID=A0A932MNL3_UNCTE|nr:ATP-binding protein [Candidatus Tectomicrobia bacterium]
MCGHLGDTAKACSCTPKLVERYRSRLSGPLLDRIDIHIEVPRLPWKELAEEPEGESSEAIRARVEAARAVQRARFEGITGIHSNAHMGAALVNRFCRTDAEGKRLLQMAVQRLGLSARAYHRVLKLARTIADLAGEASIAPAHLAEAIQYRQLDRPAGR